MTVNNVKYFQILMTISTAGTSFFLFTLATYSYLNEKGFVMEQLSWIPIVSLSLSIFVASLGIIPLPYVIITELMPTKVRSLINSEVLLDRTFLFHTF